MGSEKHQLHKVLLAKSVLPSVDGLLTAECSALGLLMGAPEARDFNTSSSSQEKRGICDRFKLDIPYAGLMMSWEILFDSHRSTQAPDIIFRSEDDSFNLDMRKVTVLENWNSKDPQNLVHLIRQVLEQYKQYQKSLIDQNSRLSTEYICLSAKYDNVEVHASKRAGNKLGSVNFLIKLPIDFTALPVQLLKEHPGEDSALLLVNFASPDGGKVTPQLFLSPQVESVLGGVSQLRLPSYHVSGGMVEYVPVVCQLLKRKIDQVCDGFQRKKEYIAAFQSHFGRSVLECDNVEFSKISLLQEWNDFFFAVHIRLSGSFPVEQPSMTFQSIYHEDGNMPYRAIITDYTYSPRCTGIEMAVRACLFFLDYIPSFQKSSLSGGTL